MLDQTYILTEQSWEMVASGENLRLEKVERFRFERNTIHQAFCELRFPTLPEIDKDPPREFVKRIRHAFPHFQQGVGLKIGITDKGMEQVPQATHSFLSTDRNWTSWIRTSSLGLETRAYVDFEDFLSRVSVVLDAALPCLDTDFFTRVGLRYINVLPAEIGDLEGWINENLYGPLSPGPMAGAQHCFCDIRGTTDQGSYTFRYGLVSIEGEGRRYILDADFAEESVEWSSAIDCLKRLNETNYNLYSWAIGPRTVEYLGKAVKKGQ
jgi:uncharacterized protein (TIGR04255 family)